MNKRQSIRYLIIQQLLVFISNYLTFFKTSKLIPPSIDNLKLQVKNIDAIKVQIKPKATKTPTAQKNAAKTEVVTQIIAAAQNAIVWAKSQNNLQLIQDFSVTKTKFKTGIIDLITLAEYTHNVFVDNSAHIIANTDVTSNQIAAIGDAITHLKALQVAPSTARSTQKTIKALYPAAFKKASDAQNDFIKLVRSIYASGPNAYPQLILDLENSLLYNDDVQHTRFHVTFLNSITKALIEGAVVTITELNKSATSTISGLATIYQFTPNTYHVTFQANGYITQTQIITFHLGKKSELLIELVPIPTT